MTQHLLPPRRRAIGLLFPGLIIALAFFIFPPFVSSGLGWWPVFILAPGAIIATIVAVEWPNVAIGFDDTGVQYQAVGYRLTAPWDGVTLVYDGDKPTLVATGAERVLSPWFDFLLRIAAILTPRRAVRAVRMVSNVPLYYFTASNDDAVMRDFRTAAPAALLKQAMR